MYFIGHEAAVGSGTIWNLRGVEVDYSANHTEPSTCIKGNFPWK